MVVKNGGGAVDGARQHRADQDDEDGVEGRFFRERTPIANRTMARPTMKMTKPRSEI